VGLIRIHHQPKLLLGFDQRDDNVHFQNTIQMTDALIKAQKQFRLMVYPDKTHGISGSGTRTQLFHMMEDFWNEEFHPHLFLNLNLNPTLE